jgi:hypothetical protein
MGVGEGVQSTAERRNRATGSGSEGSYARACTLPVPHRGGMRLDYSVSLVPE